MTVRLVILGLLRERPLYGYEIKQLVEEHMSDWTSIAFGSIYFALEKLADEKFVEKVEIEQDNKRLTRQPLFLSTPVFISRPNWSIDPGSVIPDRLVSRFVLLQRATFLAGFIPLSIRPIMWLQQAHFTM
jgi:hypothetical protein